MTFNVGNDNNTANDTKWEFVYNADGLRTMRTNGSTTYNYVYNGSSLSQMTVGGNTLTFAYDASGSPMAVVYNGAVYYYITNLQGDVVAILDSNANTVVEYTYDAWGRILTTSGSMATTLGVHNPLRYRGYVYDSETQLYYLQSRYYDPALGRFINADAFASTGQGLLGNNMFAYCNNNPTNRADYTGESIVAYKGDLLSAGASAKAGASGGGVLDILWPIVYLGDVIATHLNLVEKEKDQVIAITNVATGDSDEKAIFTPDPFNFNPSGLKMHVCVDPGTGTNGGIVKWEIPFTKIAIFEWNEDWEKGPHYHILKPEWKNKHDGIHYPIGYEVPDPWQSIYFKR